MRGREDVQILRSGPPDRYGDPGEPLPIRTVSGCQTWPRTSTEDARRGEVIIEGRNVFIPPPFVDILATDQVRWPAVGGDVYDIDGVPGSYTKGGREKGILVVLKRVGA